MLLEKRGTDSLEEASNTRIRLTVLVLLCCQNAGHALLTRYSRVRKYRYTDPMYATLILSDTDILQLGYFEGKLLKHRSRAGGRSVQISGDRLSRRNRQNRHRYVIYGTRPRRVRAVYLISCTICSIQLLLLSRRARERIFQIDVVDSAFFKGHRAGDSVRAV